MDALARSGIAIGRCGLAIELGREPLAGPGGAILRRAAAVGSGFATRDSGGAGRGSAIGCPALQGLGSPISLIGGVITSGARVIARCADIITCAAGIITRRAGAIASAAHLVAFGAGAVTLRARVVTPGRRMVAVRPGLVSALPGVVTRAAGVVTLNAGVISAVGSIVALLGGVIAPLSRVIALLARLVALRPGRGVGDEHRIRVARGRGRAGGVALLVFDLPTRGVHGTIVSGKACHEASRLIWTTRARGSHRVQRTTSESIAGCKAERTCGPEVQLRPALPGSRHGSSVIVSSFGTPSRSLLPARSTDVKLPRAPAYVSEPPTIGPEPDSSSPGRARACRSPPARA